MTEQKKPNVNSAAEKELQKLDEKFQQFKEEVSELSNTNHSLPKLETENQTKLSQKDLDKSKEIYLKPEKSIGPGRDEIFNEKYRDEYNFKKEYVNFMAENVEIIGETIEVWTKKFRGTNCEFWKVPVNKPVWGPRYLAEQIADNQYVVYEMQEQASAENYAGSTGFGAVYGKMVGKQIKSRIKAFPMNQRRSIFMGETSFKSA